MATPNKSLFAWIKFAIIFAIVLVIVPSALIRCTRVDSSEVGVKFNKLSLTDQGTLDATAVTGYVFFCPITTDVFKYETYVQRVDYEPFTVTTRDAAIFTMDPTMAYFLNRSKAVDVFFKYRRPLRDIEDGYMRTVIYDAYRITANGYTSDELMANRAKFESEVRQMLDSTLTVEGFTVTEFTSQITPPESLRQMIEAKNAAVQAALKAENEVKEAEANAKIAVAKAEGEARAMKIKADAEAYYNRTIAASLSPLIVQEDWIEKWDGKLPQVQGSEKMMPVINVSK
ncbi:MAG: SPFH domain-containing protein [Bacteroidales bacterium]|nr:SPFH domain-containing protein [Bacteroidales bacterium]